MKKLPPVNARASKCNLCKRALGHLCALCWMYSTKGPITTGFVELHQHTCMVAWKHEGMIRGAVGAGYCAYRIINLVSWLWLQRKPTGGLCHLTAPTVGIGCSVYRMAVINFAGKFGLELDTYRLLHCSHTLSELIFAVCSTTVCACVSFVPNSSVANIFMLIP